MQWRRAVVGPHAFQVWLTERRLRDCVRGWWPFVGLGGHQRHARDSEHRADLNATNEFGIPLLFEVAQLGYRDLLVWLLQHGADPTKKKSDGQSLDEHLAECGETDMIGFIKEHVTPTA